MTARTLDGKALAARVRERIAAHVSSLVDEHGITPGLAAVLVGDDPASKIYVGAKRRACENAGILSRQVHLDAGISQSELGAVIDDLNGDDEIHGILLQLPLPEGLDAEPIQERIVPAKDVDALHPITGGRLLRGDPTFLPCTPYGILEILRDAGTELSGARVVVVGRSILVGRPLSVLLSLKGIDATVVQTHSRTRDLGEETRRADVLVAAVGVAGLISADMVRPGATVIDVGINRLDDGSLVGDVAHDEVAEVAGAITPVPGGVGPMTVTMLLQNTLEAARVAAGLPRRP
jgi:methylenetetrahydrofolate dehydrogenase (NADP+) / methenyltetrahydrofolate cyclohydrolase